MWTPSANQMGHPAIDEGDSWTLTAYTVNPSSICTVGRTADQYNAQGTGYGLWIQNSTNPEASIEIPLAETEAQAGGAWGHGHCFYTMGNHYWYKISADMDCANLFPYFLLYNKGSLNAFGFAIDTAGEFSNSKRWEHPPSLVLGQFITPVPNCLANQNQYSKHNTMHIYFTDWPRTTCLC